MEQEQQRHAVLPAKAVECGGLPPLSGRQLAAGGAASRGR